VLVRQERGGKSAFNTKKATRMLCPHKSRKKARKNSQMSDTIVYVLTRVRQHRHITWTTDVRPANSKKMPIMLDVRMYVKTHNVSV
jgi:hypothetical protein